MTVTLSLEIKYVYFFLKHKLLLPWKLQKKHIYYSAFLLRSDSICHSPFLLGSDNKTITHLLLNPYK